MHLLVTRPEPEAARTAATLRARGHTVIVVPLMRIEALADVEIGAGPWAGLLMTSANAARAIAAHPRFAELRGLPVFAVGARSACALRAAGFAEVTSADGGVGDLARLVAASAKPAMPLLYLAATDRRGDLAGALGRHGISVHTVALYRAIAASLSPAAAAEAFAIGIGGVLHLSPRSADAYVSAAQAAGLLAVALKRPVHFCLSASVAEPLAAAGAADIRVARRPTEAALIELIPAA